MLGPASVLRKPMDKYKNKKKVTANRPFYLVTPFLIRCPFYKLRPRKKSVLSKVPRQVPPSSVPTACPWPQVHCRPGCAAVFPERKRLDLSLAEGSALHIHSFIHACAHSFVLFPASLGYN